MTEITQKHLVLVPSGENKIGYRKTAYSYKRTLFGIIFTLGFGGAWEFYADSYNRHRQETLLLQQLNLSTTDCHIATPNPDSASIFCNQHLVFQIDIPENFILAGWPLPQVGIQQPGAYKMSAENEAFRSFKTKLKALYLKAPYFG